ncbi:MAG: NnrS family protein, partial [Microbacteriaceae bacterium]|nr:NnrS family protein [Microbacteriaceae bacterium]
MSDTAALTTQPPAPEGRPVLPILVSVEPGEPAAESGSTWNTEFPDGLQSVGTAMTGALGWRLGITCILVLISVIGGRIVPAFTR